MKPNIKKLLILNAPYLLFVYLFDKVGQAVRLSPGADLSGKLLSIGSGFSAAFSNALPSFAPMDLLIGIVGAVVIRLAVYVKGKNAKKYRKGMEYGSARWGNAEDIKPYIDPIFENNVLLTQTERLMMSSRPKHPKYARNKNVLVIGGSGSGKTRFFVKPNLMQMHSSYVVTDPKGTVLIECGKLLQRGGYKIKVLNTINFKKSMRYNPFAYLRSEKDILKLVNTIIANTKGDGEKSGEDFWVKSERLFYCALIGYIWYEAPENEKNFTTLLEMINASEAREDDPEFQSPVDLMFERLEEKDPEHFAVRQYKKYKAFADIYRWSASTVVEILKKQEYLGHTVNFKTRKHFKDKKSHYVDESEWTIFENTHEAIIDQETFDNVQRVRGNARRYPDGFGEAYPLTGLMYCADCGGKMYVHRTYNGKRVPQYTCGQYGKYPIGSLCPTQHRIKAEAVLTLIADMLRTIAEYSRNDRAEFIRTVQETQAAQQTADISKKRKRLAAAQKRAGELERLICKIYEDNALGKLPDARYEALDAQYAKEQDALNAEIVELEKAVTGYEQSRKSAEKFIALIDKYENFDTLTNTMLNEFVEKILVHERARKGSQDTTQEVEIYFNFVGRYIPPALQPVPLTPEEQEELRKKEERKDRLHQNYLRRKANGKQKEWEERYNAKRKAKMEAAKAAIRAEDMEKGIFTTVSQLPRQEPRKATVSASTAV